MKKTAIPGCETCTETGRRGTCAPLRCYCGHRTCHAFASFVERSSVPDVQLVKPPRPNAWADREESTWIDKL